MPDLRNGTPETIQEAVSKTTIPHRYKWVIPDGLPNDKVLQYLPAVIAAQYGQLIMGVDVVNNRALADRYRMEAILLGSQRGAIQATYKLTAGDFMAAECEMSAFSYRTAESDQAFNARLSQVVANVDLPEEERAADLATRRAAVVRRGEGIYGATGGDTVGARAAREASFGDMTESEQKISIIAAWIGIPVPVLQGASLIHSGHHFIKGTKNMFRGVLKQASFMITPEWESMAGVFGESLEDLLFHKSCHPLSIEVKKLWSKSHTMKANLKACGHKAAVIRLPALPAETQALKAGLAVIIKAAGVIKQLGGTVDTSGGERLKAQLEGTIEGGETLTDAELKAKVEEAVRWAEFNAGEIAYCSGVVDGLRTAGQALRDTELPKETTTAALSVKKTIAAHTAQYVLGGNLAKLLMLKDREDLASKGKIERVIKV